MKQVTKIKIGYTNFKDRTYKLRGISSITIYGPDGEPEVQIIYENGRLEFLKACAPDKGGPADVSGAIVKYDDNGDLCELEACNRMGGTMAGIYHGDGQVSALKKYNHADETEAQIICKNGELDGVSTHRPYDGTGPYRSDKSAEACIDYENGKFMEVKTRAEMTAHDIEKFNTWR